MVLHHLSGPGCAALGLGKPGILLSLTQNSPSFFPIALIPVGGVGCCKVVLPSLSVAGSEAACQWEAVLIY